MVLDGTATDRQTLRKARNDIATFAASLASTVAASA
jgi:hypothetical protein